MATRASLGVRTTSTTVGAACLEIFAGAKPFRLIQLDISIVGATASAFALGRPAALGVTPTTPLPPLVESGGDPASITARTALAWVTPPTVPTAFYRRVLLPATAGVGMPFPWTFFEAARDGAPNFGIIVPVLGSLVVWNITANALADINFVIEE